MTVVPDVGEPAAIGRPSRLRTLRPVNGSIRGERVHPDLWRFGSSLLLIVLLMNVGDLIPVGTPARLGIHRNDQVVGKGIAAAAIDEERRRDGESKKNVAGSVRGIHGAMMIRMASEIQEGRGNLRGRADPA